MKTNTIASALCSERLEDADKRILSNDLWCDEFAARVEDAWRQVRELKRQRAGLDELFPAKKWKHERQFSAEVMDLAARVQEEIFEVTA